MSKQPNVLWLNTSPSFLRFEQPLLRYLSNQLLIGQWEYSQHQDEGSSLDIALTLLHDYLKSRNQPIHIIGHSTGGWLGLLYARKHPERVRSLTLLGVGVNPAVNWHIQYYSLLKILPCSRQIILAQMVRNLFGDQGHENTKALVRILERDLGTSPSPHSLYQQVSTSAGGVSVPLMVCGSRDDVIVDPNSLYGWQTWLKDGDRLWECPQGHHFFHYFHPQKVGRQVLRFWKSLPALGVGLSPSVTPMG